MARRTFSSSSRGCRSGTDLTEVVPGFKGGLSCIRSNQKMFLTIIPLIHEAKVIVHSARSYRAFCRDSAVRYPVFLKPNCS